MVLAAALLFSTGGAAIKTQAFSAPQVSCVRSGLAFLVLLAWGRRRIRFSPTALAIGVAYASVLTLFVASTKLTTSANAIFLQSTAPLYILILGPLILREHLQRGDILYMSALAAGLVLCFIGQPSSTAIAPNPALGNVLGLACSIAWALTLIGLRWGQRKDGNVGVSAVAYGNLIACAVALPFAWPFPAAATADWATLVYLGVVQIGLAYILLTAAMRELPALEVSLLLLLEPVLNPVWTWFLRGEAPGGWVIAGGAIIIGATAVRSVNAVGSKRPV